MLRLVMFKAQGHKIFEKHLNLASWSLMVIHFQNNIKVVTNIFTPIFLFLNCTNGQMLYKMMLSTIVISLKFLAA